jgi:hypothetical protein
MISDHSLVMLNQWRKWQRRAKLNLFPNQWRKWQRRAKLLPIEIECLFSSCHIKEEDQRER